MGISYYYNESIKQKPRGIVYSYPESTETVAVVCCHRDFHRLMAFMFKKPRPVTSLAMRTSYCEVLPPQLPC